MSKAVLISIQPKWCGLIASGKKTIEIRKTKPKLKTPFKVYIYCTKDFSLGEVYLSKDLLAEPVQGKVIGEFVCDAIISHCEMANADIAEQRGYISREDILKYSKGKEVFGWHISDLVIYEKPKALSEFTSSGALSYDDWTRNLYNAKGYAPHCYENYLLRFRLKRPPQSWCYVEGGNE